ncbi:MAG: carbamoyl-phosphate synthase (glutamine-hydrolyzing) small subunit, partial [Candidatus Aenigmarchaeota archaeon]|nr:carbamoyl-phosphate synthase (glutamine-hydrolyzing) small subunit [Candidatus Aenigmarchaeota archaeon]
EVNTKKCYITSQNHGFAIKHSSLPKGVIAWFENANDKTVEGICHKDKPIAAVQFHPEATPGPNDTSWLFDDFLKGLNNE